jgi:hypothetical protein
VLEGSPRNETPHRSARRGFNSSSSSGRILGDSAAARRFAPRRGRGGVEMDGDNKVIGAR